MKEFYKILFILIFTISESVHGQNLFVAVQNGDWNNGATWGNASPGVIGVDWPGSGDDANTNGYTVSVNGNFQCRNMLVEVNPIGSTSLSIPAPSTSLTINGTFTGFDNAQALAFSPSSAVLTGAGRLIFTGNNIGGLEDQGVTNEILANWSSSAPIPRATFNLGTNTGFIDFIYNQGNFTAEDLVINTAVFQSGTVITNITLFKGIATNNLTINAGAILNTFLPITQDGTPTSRMTLLRIDGELNTNSYLNSANINIGAAGLLKTAFRGPDQLEGWWYQTSSPDTYTLTGSIEYEVNGNQNISVIPTGYGNLQIEGTGTKTFAGGGSLLINGNFKLYGDHTIVENGQPIQIRGSLTMNSTWVPDVNLVFEGTSNQQIKALNPPTFNGALIISNTSGIVSLDNQPITLNSYLDINENATFDPGSRNVTILGDLIVDGTLVAGTNSSSFIFNGTTDCTGSDISFNNFTINNSASFTAPPAGTINVAKFFFNGGTFNPNQGTVVFNGTVDQGITETQKIRFHNLNIDNSNGAKVSVNGRVDLTGRLTMSSDVARFDADGGNNDGVFTVKSSSLNEDGQIGPIPVSANFAGRISVERYVDGRSDPLYNWRFLSVPITNANVSMWQDDFPVTGKFSNPSTTSPETQIIDPNAASISFWNTNTLLWDEIGNGGTTASTALQNGRGYSVYTYRTSDFVITVRGDIEKGGFSRSVTPNAWNLVGNPLPSTIDWDNMNIAGFYSAMYLQNLDGSLATYTQGGTGTNHPNPSWAGEISMGQAFWVYSEGANRIPFSEASKTTSPHYQFLREAQPENLLRIALKNDEQKDEITIRFAKDVKDEFEPRYDALKFKNGRRLENSEKYSYINFSSYIVDPDKDMAINSIPFLEDCSKSVFLKIQDVAEGNHSISFTNLEAFQLGYSVRLIDNYTGETMDITGSEEYKFSVTADAASYGNERFEIEFSTSLTDRAYNFYSENECSGDFVNVTVENAVAGAVYEVHKAGKLVADAVAEGHQLSIRLPKSFLSKGKTNFDLTCRLENCGQDQFLENAFHVEYDSIYEITGVENQSICGSGMVVLRASGAPADGYYRWYENEEDGIPIANETQAELIIDKLDKTTTFYVAAVNANGCESTVRQAVQGIVGDINGLTPIVDQTVLQACADNSVTLTAGGAPDDGSYVWYDEGENILQANEKTGSFTTPLLKDSSVFYVAIANQENCTGEKVKINVPVIRHEKPVITEEKGILVSSHSSDVQWYRDNELIPGATGRTYDTKLAGGNYTVEYWSGQCSILSEPIFIEGVGDLKNVEVSDLITLYPNPVKSQLFVEYKEPADGSVRLLIYTSEGKLIDSGFMENFPNSHKKTIDVSHYAGGIFITVVYDGQKYVYSKFSKQ